MNEVKTVRLYSAIVLMAVGLKKWKMPVSFRFTAGLTAETLSVLIKRAITLVIKMLMSRQYYGRVKNNHFSNGPTSLRYPKSAVQI